MKKQSVQAIRRGVRITDIWTGKCVKSALFSLSFSLVRSARGAHPGLNRVGIIFFACVPYLCRERQATL